MLDGSRRSAHPTVITSPAMSHHWIARIRPPWLACEATMRPTAPSSVTPGTRAGTGKREGPQKREGGPKASLCIHPALRSVEHDTDRQGRDTELHVVPEHVAVVILDVAGP